MHSYNIDVGALKTWRDDAILLGLQIPTGATTRLESIEIARDPRGPAELEVTYFGPTDGINRAAFQENIDKVLEGLAKGGGGPEER